MAKEIDKDWFVGRLQQLGKTMRGMGRHLQIDASAASRMLSGDRKMRMDEAERIARFLETTTEEVLAKAGIEFRDGAVRSIMLAATIGEQGNLTAIEPRALPAAVLARAQATIAQSTPGKMIAAQVRATNGPLSMLDDAVVLYAETGEIEPSAVGVLSIARLRDGVTLMGHVERARKTGEAKIRMSNGDLREVLVSAISPVLAVLP